MPSKRGGLLLLAMAAGLVGWGTAASASPAFMPIGGRATQPIGHYEFCRKSPAECRQKTASATPVALTRELWAEMIDINNSVNATVTPKTDMEMWGKEEVWSYPVDGYGDCEDYVLEKRRDLMKLGVPAGNLLITVVRQANGDGHAVLTVRTSGGDFILDNLEDRVLRWYDTDYTFLKRQSDRDSGVWVEIDDGAAAAAVASVR